MYADEVEKEGRNTRTFVRRVGRGNGIDGKWKHDRYTTSQRPASKQQFKPKVITKNISVSSIRASGNHVPTIRKTIVTTPVQPAGPSTLFLSNLASTVSQEDLEELFQEYSPEVVSLHYDSNGQSLGTADLVVPQDKVPIIQKFLEGVQLDGQQIEVLEANVASKVSVFDRIKKVGPVVRTTTVKPMSARVRVVVKPNNTRFIKRRRF